jgi:hypothetical protein
LGGRKGKGWRGQPSLDIGGLHLPFGGLSLPLYLEAISIFDPDLCRNTMKYRNTHKRRDVAEIRLHFINNK